MRYIKLLLAGFFIFGSCSVCKKDVDPYDMKPPYKLLNLFSRKIQPETGLILISYGYNWCLPKDYQKKGIGNFSASYKLVKNRTDEVSLEYSRSLMVFLVENLLIEININSEVRKDLDFYPFVSDFLSLTFHFKDENQIDLAQGVASVHLTNGKIKYRGYNIEEYRSTYPAVGKHFTIYEETYADALEIVRKQGPIKHL